MKRDDNNYLSQSTCLLALLYLSSLDEVCYNNGLIIFSGLTEHSPCD